MLGSGAVFFHVLDTGVTKDLSSTRCLLIKTDLIGHDGVHMVYLIYELLDVGRRCFV